MFFFVTINEATHVVKFDYLINFFSGEVIPVIMVYHKTRILEASLADWTVYFVAIEVLTQGCVVLGLEFKIFEFQLEKFRILLEVLPNEDSLGDRHGSLYCAGET